MRKLRNINDVHFAIFQQKYAPRKRDAPHNQIIGINPSSMPPCQSVLINKIHRTNCVACLWRRAPLRTPCTMKAEAHGWSLENGTYKIKWYDGDQLPRNFCPSTPFVLLGHRTLHVKRLSPCLQTCTQFPHGKQCRTLYTHT